MLDVCVVLPAAGNGERFGNKTPKQFIEVLGKPLICYSVEAFHRISWVKKIVIVASKSGIEGMNKIIAQRNYGKVVIVEGGNFRHESIYAGVKALQADCKENEIVVIHDGVRPFIKEEFLAKLVEEAQNHKACGAVRKCVSTIVKCSGEGFMETSLKRSELRASEMPQCFWFCVILKAFEKCSEEEMRTGTECLQLVQTHCDLSPKLVEGPTYLWKITYEEDLSLMELYIKKFHLMDKE